MLIDYHLHDHFSPDSETETKKAVQAERDLGIRHICITNHGEWFEDGEGIPSSFKYEEAFVRFQKASKEANQVQKIFPDMQIGFGAEIQYEEGNMEEVKRFTQALPFDFMLGSIHNLQGINISGHLHVDQFLEGKSEEEAYECYFADMLKLVEWGHFDAVAHFDIIKKYGINTYGPFQPQKYKTTILNILQIMKTKGIGIELNTGSLHKRCKTLFPHPDILKWCVEIGIENYTLGSDAHKNDEYGRHLDEALQIAKEVGIKSLSTYEKRVPTKHDIFS